MISFQELWFDNVKSCTLFLYVNKYIVHMSH